LRQYRILVLPLAAALIAGLVIWRIQIDGRQKGSGSSARTMVMAQNHGFMLTDQHRHLTKLQGYLGRTKLILVFFDGNLPAHTDPIVARIRDDFDKLKAQGVQPIAISTASPFAIQKSEELSGRKFPFPVLMDVDPNGLLPTPAHVAWGLRDPRTETLKTGTFLIDRMGRVSARGFVPQPVKDPQHVIDTILRGEWVEEVDASSEQAPMPEVPGPSA
jgi:peroxiredoxin